MALESDDLTYRTPVTSTGSSQNDVSTLRDERNYDTLRAVQKDFQASVDGLYKDFNAFEILRGATTEEGNTDMRLQIGIKQGAYDILAPLLETLNTALQTVDDKYKTGGAL